MRILSILALALLVFAAQAANFRTAQAAEPEIHYAPVENLEHIDIELIRSATKSVDMAAFTLTDWVIIAALKEVHGRDVTIRILLDPSQRQEYCKLAEMADIVRVKKRGRPLNAPQGIRHRRCPPSHRICEPQSERAETTR
jgi:phosphatidylserine/phosphatidylglycerophosphate/cardiolipin synthase-like enzyme